MLYRHGYQQFAGKISADKSGEAREFRAAPTTSLQGPTPSRPLRAFTSTTSRSARRARGGKLVQLGFHSVA